MFFSAADFSIHKYGQRFCLNDVVLQCELSTNPKSYYKDVKDKSLHKGNYYITKTNLIEILTKAKAPKSKILLELLNNDKEEEIIKQQIVDFVDSGNNTIHFNGSLIKYFIYNNQIYFKAKEIAKILGYENKSQAIRVNVEPADMFPLEQFKGGLLNSAPYKTNEVLKLEALLADEDTKTIFINESGLYSLILSSKKTQAKKFKLWVTSDVLPSIRKYGTYSLFDKIDYSLEKLDYYKDKDIVYVLHVKDNIYKFGTSYEIIKRIKQHVKNLKFNKIIKLYQVDNRSDGLNCETKIKHMVRKLKIHSDFMGGLEFFETNSNYDINLVIQYIDEIVNQTKLESKYKLAELVPINDINNLSDLYKSMKEFVDSSVINQQIVNKLLQLELNQQKIELTNEKELFFQIKLKELDLEIKKVELELEKVRKPSLIQQLIDAKIIGNGKQNMDSIDLDIMEETEDKTPSGGTKKTTIKAKIQNNPVDKKCADCGCDVAVRSVRCGKCENNRRLKQSIETNKNRPTLSQLQKDLETQSYVQVGKKYGVSDNCIRKWIKKFKSYNKLTN